MSPRGGLRPSNPGGRPRTGGRQIVRSLPTEHATAIELYREHIGVETTSQALASILAHPGMFGAWSCRQIIKAPQPEPQAGPGRPRTGNVKVQAWLPASAIDDLAAYEQHIGVTAREALASVLAQPRKFASWKKRRSRSSPPRAE